MEEIIIENLQVKINKTFFEYSVIYLRHEAFQDMPDKCDFVIHYKFRDDDRIFDKKHSASKQNNNTEYKIQCGKDFTLSVASKAFGASKAAWYLSDDPQLDIGEYLIFDVKRIGEQYYLCAKGVHELPDEEKVKIDDEEYSAKVLRKIATTFIPRYTGAKVPDKEEKGRVLWNNPTDWIKYDENSEDFKQSLNVYNAVYMWIGHKDASTRYIYVGIVGDDNNISNSVGLRMKQHIIDKKIQIDCFRYSELVNSGENDKVEVLKTVEMQCINMVSGLIQGKHEDIIHGKINMAYIDDVRYKICMPNKSVRFQQGYGSGDLKIIS